MFEWIARNWQHEWLGNLAWWQGVAGVVQAVFAVVLFIVTRDLARLGQFQSRLQKQSLKISLFEKRLAVFHTLMAFLGEFAQTARADPGRNFQLLHDTNTAEFLFEPKIQAFIDHVYKTATRVHALQADRASEGDHRHRQASSEDLTRLETWLSSDAFEEAKTLFTPYLRFSNQDWEEPKFLTLRP